MYGAEPLRHRPPRFGYTFLLYLAAASTRYFVDTDAQELSGVFARTHLVSIVCVYWHRCVQHHDVAEVLRSVESFSVNTRAQYLVDEAWRSETVLQTDGYGSGGLRAVLPVSIYCCLCVADVGGPHVDQELLCRVMKTQQSSSGLVEVTQEHKCSIASTFESVRNAPRTQVC